MRDSIVSEIKNQGKSILAMMAVAIISILAMIVLDFFTIVTHGMTALGIANASDGILTLNETVSATLNLFIVSFGIVGAFASITMLIVVIKVIIGVVKGLKS